MASLPKLLHLPATTSSVEIVEALESDAALIVDDLLDAEAVSQVASELAPFVEAGRAGVNDFGGRSTVRIGALMARFSSCRKVALHEPRLRIEVGSCSARPCQTAEGNRVG